MCSSATKIGSKDVCASLISCKLDIRKVRTTIPCVSLPRQFGGLAPRQARQGLTFRKIRCVALSHQANPVVLLVAPRHEAAEVAAARTFDLGPEQRSRLIVQERGV